MNRFAIHRPTRQSKALTGGYTFKHATGPLVALLFLVLGLALGQGCARLQKKPPVETTPSMVQPVPLQNYAEFIKQNMDYINAVYSTDYAPYVFVVDTERGSRPVQALLEPEAVAGLADRLNRDARSNSVKVANIYNHVIDNFRYHPMPHQWEPVSEVVRSGFPCHAKGRDDGPRSTCQRILPPWSLVSLPLPLYPVATENQGFL
jgi:hypothetical protein